MAKAIIMPKQGNTVEECLLVSWAIKPGDTLEVGQAIGEIETDKATFPLESTAAGEVLALLCDEGDTVPVLQNIVVVGTAGEDISEFTSGAAAPPADAAPAQAAPAAAAPAVSNETIVIPADQQPVSVLPSQTSRGVSPRARSLASRIGIAPAAIPGTGPGGRVIERDVAAAAASGSPMTPLAKAVAADTGMRAPASGSGIGGRVLAGDLVAGGAPVAADVPAGSLPAEYEEVSLSGIRKIIGQRMQESLLKTAQLTINMTANATALRKMRSRVKANAEKLNVANITINDMILFVVSRVLKSHLALNATMADGVYRKYGSVNLAFACTTDRGLMVPVIQNADRLTLDTISVVAKDYALQARDGAINPDLLQGGTITISNLGMLGITDFTPILNYPQVAILGVNSIRVVPVRRDGEVVFEDHIGFSLTVNHQAVDGWDAGLFLRDVCQAVENFDLLLMQG